MLYTKTALALMLSSSVHSAKALPVESTTASAVELQGSCTGAGTLPGNGPFCYHAKIGMFGVTETIDMKVTRTSDPSDPSEKGKMDMIGGGISPFECTAIDIEKDGQEVHPDTEGLSHCLPRGVTLSKAQYCSDTDEVVVTIKDSNIPLSPSLSGTAQRVDCAKAELMRQQTFSYPKTYAGKSLSLTWEDCGNGQTHAVVTDVQPTMLQLGTTTTISGEGDLDADQDGGSYELTMTGVGGVSLLQGCKGNAKEASTCTIGLGPIKVGSLKYGGISFPQAAGHVTNIPQIDLTLPSGLPDFATETTTTFKVASTDGSPMICAKIHTKAA